MHRLYGTYLIHLVAEVLQRNSAATVKEIALEIHNYESPTLQRNLEERIRRALKHMETERMVEKEVCPMQCNLFAYNYKLATNE